ncbi:MAG TPA: tetratricopeptide repeat protein [Rhizomicrobium sp.]|jgi:predicted Zn-dependent protease|nr:tetratricopeptide repeat protein [Rhizomicrobium sp.]
MRRLMGLMAAAAALFAVTTPSFSMGGGGGGGGGGGNMGGGYSGGGTTTLDEYTVAVRLIKHEKYADAIPHLLMAHVDKPNDADILNYLGFTNRMTGNYDSSMNYYKQALAIDPNHKGVHEYLGELYLQLHDQASAQHELDTLASLCPSGCDERDTLTKAIAAYVPPAGAAAPTATAAPATTPASN